MVIQQRVPSRILNRGYNYPEAPVHDWCRTIHPNRAQDPTPRHPHAVAESRRRDVVIGPTAQVETRALLRRIRENPSGPEYKTAFRPAIERSSSEDSDIDEHRRGRRYVQQVRFQEQALQELASQLRHARPARAPQRRPWKCWPSSHVRNFEKAFCFISGLMDPEPPPISVANAHPSLIGLLGPKASQALSFAFGYSAGGNLVWKLLSFDLLWLLVTVICHLFVIVSLFLI